MNYKESQQVKEKIDSAHKFLVNCHHNPDADSVGSALAMARILKSLGKEVRIVSPSKLSSNLNFLLTDDKIDIVEFSQIDYSAYDIFITLDSSSWPRVAGSSSIACPQIPIVVIDHHATNTSYGEINLVVAEAAANCVILYKLFQDWQIEFNSQIAEPLLAGILGDTGGLRFPEADSETFEITLQLMKQADKNKIMFNLYQSYEMGHINVWKEIMNNLQIDAEHKFVYSFVEKQVMEKNGHPDNAKAEISDILFQSIEGTDFGVVGVEDEGYVSVSFRSRTGKDVSKLASALGGGGHQWASAARIHQSFEEAVETILNKCREFANENNQ